MRLAKAAIATCYNSKGLGKSEAILAQQDKANAPVIRRFCPGYEVGPRKTGGQTP
ncbi:hypothetical protein [Rhabdonatronobacter sediminivivens]|uniref:hypothetical protein n=1 Tax=Rhabdonatronobacter sediminivivens TaxID=2743469 RepID=UPI0015D08A89|nr:hypothetical protein [Rhabdonatronobacter sediminivivens]